MYSGFMTLLEEVGLSLNDLDRVILAGGFGSYVDLEKAMIIGLLPEMDPGKVTYIGNGSLLGARAFQPIASQTSEGFWVVSPWNRRADSRQTTPWETRLATSARLWFSVILAPGCT